MKNKNVNEVPDNLTAVLAHPDDETMLGSLISKSELSRVVIASDGSASTLNFSRRYLCQCDGTIRCSTK
jgi:LmbE family N-acetylglucosaminyl deacetylase